jgi:hypothetical protein
MFLLHPTATSVDDEGSGCQFEGVMAEDLIHQKFTEVMRKKSSPLIPKS